MATLYHFTTVGLQGDVVVDVGLELALQPEGQRAFVVILLPVAVTVAQKPMIDVQRSGFGTCRREQFRTWLGDGEEANRRGKAKRGVGLRQPCVEMQ